MNFHDNLCGIHDQDKIPITRTYAHALNQQARQLLLPLYREVCVKTEWNERETIPLPNDFLLNALSFASDYGRLNFIEHWEVEKIASNFIENLPSGSKELLAFYMHSTEHAIRRIACEIDEGLYDDLLVGLQEDQKLPAVFHQLIKQVRNVDIYQWLEEELGNIQNFLSVDMLMDWDEYSVSTANENFAMYLGISYEDVKLFPNHGHEYYIHEEPFEIFVHTGNFSHNVPAKWYGPNLVPKGYHLDLGDRSDALRTLFDDSLERVLMAVEASIISFFDLKNIMSEGKINYTFFSPFKSMDTFNYKDGISFFHAILKEYVEHNFDSHINIDLSKTVGEVKQEWGTQVHIAYGSEPWMGIDEDTEYSVWLLYIENEQVTIDEAFSPTQVTNIVSSVIGYLARCYALDYEAS